MAGHSHASNVKHKKDRNDKLKSGNFLKLRKKLENLYLEEGNYEKLASIARENNFPIEKVKAIVEKLASSQQTTASFVRFLYRSEYQLVWCLEGFFDQKQITVLEQKVNFFQLENLATESIFEHFEHLYLLRLRSEQDFEDLALSLFSPLVIDKIKRIDRVETCGFNFEVVFSEKQIRDEAVESLKAQFRSLEFQTENFLSPFQLVKLTSERQVSYFLSLKKSFSELGDGVKIFTNTSNEREDHSSVG